MIILFLFGIGWQDKIGEICVRNPKQFGLAAVVWAHFGVTVRGASLAGISGQAGMGGAAFAVSQKPQPILKGTLPNRRLDRMT
jgi:hypothetical protein